MCGLMLSFIRFTFDPIAAHLFVCGLVPGGGVGCILPARQSCQPGDGAAVEAGGGDCLVLVGMKC